MATSLAGRVPTASPAEVAWRRRTCAVNGARTVVAAVGSAALRSVAPLVVGHLPRNTKKHPDFTATYTFRLDKPRRRVTMYSGMCDCIRDPVKK